MSCSEKCNYILKLEEGGREREGGRKGGRKGERDKKGEGRERKGGRGRGVRGEKEWVRELPLHQSQLGRIHHWK